MLQVPAGWQWAAGSETSAGHKGNQSQAGVRDRDWKQKEDLPQWRTGEGVGQTIILLPSGFYILCVPSSVMFTETG